MEEERIQLLREKILWINFTSYCVYIPLSLKVWTHCSTPNLFLLCNAEPHCLLYMSFPLVEYWSGRAQLEGLSFLIPRCFVTKVCWLYTYFDYFNRNSLFSYNWYLPNIWIIIPWAYLSCMLMDYANLYSNIIYYHHILAYLGCWGKVVGIKPWVACSTMVFIELSDEVGSWPCLISISFI